MPARRQTISFLQRRLADAGVRPNTRHGQNFLVDLNLIEVLLREANLGPRDVVLEVGTGTGAFTARLAEQAGAVVTVELDPQLYQLAAEELVDTPNVTMLHQDVLRNKNNLDERVVEQVRQQMDRLPGAQFKLAANLPYNIATPLIANLLLTPLTPVSMTVTIQKELAERITARRRTKAYGALSVWVQSLCQAEILRVLPPNVFWPRPKVESAIIRIEPDTTRRAAIPDLPWYHQFVRSLFFHRRKFLRSVLISALKKDLDKPRVDQLLHQAGLDADMRAEELTVAQIKRLYGCVRQAVGCSGGA